MLGVVDAMERQQVVLYLGAIGAGVAIGFGAPLTAPTMAVVITPSLAALLYVTFLQVPVRALMSAVRDVRFMGAVLTVNCVVVPLVVAAMFAFLPEDDAIRFGVLLVLLCPCVDYVIVFTGLAGGAGQRLLAATPLLLILQMVTTPLFLTAFLGAGLGSVIDVGPFLEAFVLLIVIPLVLAWSTQWFAARNPRGQRFSSGSTALMVPLMMLVLVVVVASQISQLGGAVAAVAGAIPFYVVFLIVMPVAGLIVGRWFGLDVAARRAVVFSGATRNSLVVLPLALALPAGFEAASIVVVIQTMVEVVGMVAYVRVIPLVVRAPR